MGVGGTLEYLCELMTNGRKTRKMRERVETMELKVRMDCDGCELKVKRALSSLTGVKSVEINRKQQKVTVHGYVEVSKVLRRAKSTGKRRRFGCTFLTIRHLRLVMSGISIKTPTTPTSPSSGKTTQMPALSCESSLRAQAFYHLG